jgi:class 3 adenylate cyclase/CheY-like chemotaxis protein
MERGPSAGSAARFAAARATVAVGGATLVGLGATLAPHLPVAGLVAIAALVAGALAAAVARLRRDLEIIDEQQITIADLHRSLEASHASIRSLERARGDFLEHTASTVREPIALQLATLETLLRSPMLSVDVRGALEQSIRLAKEAAAGVSAMGDTTRLRNGELKLDLMAVDLRTTLDYALEGIRRRQELTAPTFQVQAEHDVPYAYGDPDRLAQVLTTLLGRAAALSPDATIVVRITREHECLLLTIDDARETNEPDHTYLSAPALPALTGSINPIEQIRLWIAGRILLLHGYPVYCARRPEGLGFRWTVKLPRAKADSIALSSARPIEPIDPVETLAPPPSPLAQVVALTSPSTNRVAIVPGLRRAPLAGALGTAGVPKLDFSEPDSARGEHPNAPRISLIPPASVKRGAIDYEARETLVPASLKRKSVHVPDEMGVAVDPLLFRPRVLVADDDPVVRNVIAAELTELDVDVTMAVDGVDALARIQSEAPFDIIVSDIVMPRLTGVQLCKIVRETHSTAELPFVLMSSRAHHEDVVRAFEAGASDFMVKPTVKAELLQRIATHLQISRETVALTRFVPREFLRLLGRERVADVRLGDHVSKDLTILFADIRGFTSMSETFGPSGTFRFLNGCLSRIAPHIHANGGFIDKYIGDAVMALFPSNSLGAVRAAVAIQTEVDSYNREHGLTEDDREGLAIGVGIFRGPTMLGTIGEPRRFEATVISDAVNVAARLEALTRRLGVRVLVGESVLTDLSDANITLRPLGRVVARGRGEPVAVWEVLDADSAEVRREKSETMEGFLSAIDAFERGAFSEAIEAFDGVLERSPNDGPSWIYQQACQRFLTNEIPFGFRGALDFGTDK